MTAKNRAYVVFVVVVVPVTGIALFVVGPTALSSYDRNNRITAVCEVASATYGVRSSASRVGAGSSRSEIEIVTDDCGTLLLRDGVDEDDGPERAAALTPGTSYEFSVGRGSWSIRGFLNGIGKYPFTYGSAPAGRGDQPDAGGLVPGSDHPFAVGEGSWSARGVHDVFRGSPLVYDYAPVAR